MESVIISVIDNEILIKLLIEESSKAAKSVSRMSRKADMVVWVILLSWLGSI